MNEEFAPAPIIAEEEEATAGEVISGASVMGFPSHPRTTNRDLVLYHRGFVEWARSQSNPRDRLIPFVHWLDSEEARTLEQESQENQEIIAHHLGHEVFTFGQHIGESFYQVAWKDPRYHERFRSYLESQGGQPLGGTILRYENWYDGYAMTTPSLRDSFTEVFPAGEHEGKTFSQVSTQDPAYHLRHRRQLWNIIFRRYLEWFRLYSPTRFIAHQVYRHQQIQQGLPVDEQDDFEQWEEQFFMMMHQMQNFF